MLMGYGLHTWDDLIFLRYAKQRELRGCSKGERQVNDQRTVSEGDQIDRVYETLVFQSLIRINVNLQCNQ